MPAFSAVHSKARTKKTWRIPETPLTHPTKLQP
jgi:hypothetical protein